ncbi:MAG: sensor histidine kinase N-terminal domain-containing protein [Paracoccaceae bacterium]
MSWLSRSLRLRLSVLILMPLVLVSAIAMIWRFDNARNTAEGIFDRNLVMLGLAVSRDVAYSGGDTLSEITSNLFRDATGGAVFYHVNGPDGSFVTGYSSPPVRGPDIALEPNTPVLFDAVHQGVPVRAMSLAEPVEIDGIGGLSIVTVWQQLQPREDFARALAFQAVLLALLLVSTVAAVVFFGIRFGLRPLEDLEAAIQTRSTTDLRPIERQIPFEARGIVERLNDLFSRLTEAQVSQERLISNAAHQLRNPVAAIHTMAEAIKVAKTVEDSQQRASELVAETRQTMRLTQQLLSFERIQGTRPRLLETDLTAFVLKFAAQIGPKVLSANVEFEVELPTNPINVFVDGSSFSEALSNLVDNALQHAGADLSVIKIGVSRRGKKAFVKIENDGQRIPADQAEQLFERFVQGGQSQGSGLGLAIVREVVTSHNGDIGLVPGSKTQFKISLSVQRADGHGYS